MFLVNLKTEWVNNMICILLCAGYATRMYPLTENQPKSLLLIKGKTIIDYLIDDLEIKKYIDRYIIVSNDKFYFNFLEWSKTRKENIIVLNDGTKTNENRLGAVKDIEFAIEELDINEDALVMAGDNLLTFSLNEFIEFFKEQNQSSIMVYYENEFKKLIKSGVAILDEKNNVLNFNEKPSNPTSNYCCPPFYLLKKCDLSKVKMAIDGGCKVDSPGLFLEWLSDKTNLVAWKMTGERVDVGDLETYNKLNR